MFRLDRAAYRPTRLSANQLGTAIKAWPVLGLGVVLVKLVTLDALKRAKRGLSSWRDGCR